MIEDVAPYAPASAVIGTIRAYRERPIPTPITNSVLENLDIAPTITPRTLQALKLLDLIDDTGMPTVALQDLRKAGADEYRTRLAEVVRGAYAEIFMYRDPATDDVTKIEDSFRKYEPISMRPRMARLFLGLCEEAGIIASTPSVRSQSAGQSGRSGMPVRMRRSPPANVVAKTTVQGTTVAPASTPESIPGSEHLAIRGLLMTLPPVGDVFTEAQRRDWAEAVLAAFKLIYKSGADSEARRRNSPDKGGESD